MISLIADNKEVPVEWVEFSDGALTCKVDLLIKKCVRYVSLSVCPTTPAKQVLEEVGLVLDSLSQLGILDTTVEVMLHLPYLPYARGDRVFEEGDPNPLEVFLGKLYHWRDVFSGIYICDIHNKNSLTEFPKLNIIEKDQLNCFRDVLGNKYQEYSYIVAPDKGARDKANKIAKKFGWGLVQADKKRDLSNGRILETTLNADLPEGSHVIIVDDLLDGGGTFIPLAEKLKSQGCKVDLYVTHLIAAKGLDIFKGLIDNIYCYHTVGRYINKQTVLQFNSR